MTLILQDSIGNVVDYKVLTFSGGEQHIQLNPRDTRGRGVFHITAHLHSAEDVMLLLLMTDAVRQQYSSNAPITLTCPYLPYARQDRVCARGEALSLKVMCNLLNSQGYETITVWDPHSDVAPALLNHVRVVTQGELLRKQMHKASMAGKLHTHLALVSPDSGATKKTFGIAQELKAQFVQALKHRDVLTGAISGTTVDLVKFEHQTGLLVVDDICDGGRTFIELAKVLAEKYPGAQRYLYVTHGIFSRGIAPLLECYDAVLCPNVWPNVPAHDHLIR